MPQGVSIAIAAGWVIGALDWNDMLRILFGKSALAPGEMNPPDYLGRTGSSAVEAVREIVARVWLYVVIGIAIGAAIHGYVPQNLLSKSWDLNPFAVIAAVIIGIPLYSNAAGMIPVVSALMEKGTALGTALAFMMAVVGLSLPEMIILRRVLKWQLIAVFIGVMAIGIISIGILFNAVFA
jgi:uncharacterized membrane protein YraQ (UPF0718 family)